MIEIIVKKEIPIKCYIFECQKCESVFRAFEEDVYKHKGWKLFWEMVCRDDYEYYCVCPVCGEECFICNDEHNYDPYVITTYHNKKYVYDKEDHAWKTISEFSKTHKDLYDIHGWLDWDKFKKFCEESEEMLDIKTSHNIGDSV